MSQSQPPPPAPNVYRWHVSYYYQAGAVASFGHTAFDTPQPITHPDHVDELARAIGASLRVHDREGLPVVLAAPPVVVILNFRLLDAFHVDADALPPGAGAAAPSGLVTP